MKRDNWTVGEYSVRPAGKQDRCFYCGKLLGEQHDETCVIRGKTVVVDFTIRTVLDVPESWDEEQINFYYNDGSWCADNLLNKLEYRSDNVRCLCDITNAEYVKDATDKDEVDYGLTFVEKLES